jgi:hypothetical protein
MHLLAFVSSSSVHVLNRLFNTTSGACLLMMQWQLMGGLSLDTQFRAEADMIFDVVVSWCHDHVVVFPVCWG